MSLLQTHSHSRKTLICLTIATAILGSYGSCPSKSRSQLQIRSHLQSTNAFKCSDCYGVDINASFDSAVQSVPISSSATSAAAAVTCIRGGAIDDAPQRRPSRRPPPSYYDDRDRPRSGAGPRRDLRDDDARVGGPRPQGDRDRRHVQYDRDNFDDRSNRRRQPSGDRWKDDERDRRQRSERNYQPDKYSDKVKDEATKEKSKSWFSRKKKDTKELNSEMKDKYEEPESWTTNSNTPPPPPPPPPPQTFATTGTEINPAQTERTPIHYMFPTAEVAAEERMRADHKFDEETIMGDNENGIGGPEIPFLDVEEDSFADRGRFSDSRTRRRRMDDDDEDEYRRNGESGYVSPRRDAVTLYMATKRGALKVRLGSMIVGAGIGAFLGKSLMNDPYLLSTVMASLLFFTGFLRNDYGELSRALGLALIFTFQRTTSVRKDYPTLPHLKAIIRQGPRKPFPPLEEGSSAWQYEPIYEDDPEFKMTYALLSMAMVGSFCGGNVPLLPTWMGGIIGAVAFASLTTGSNAQCDLGRSMGMRVVGLFQVILTINSELRILSKTATVGGLIFDKIMIMDRKHKIKDKIVSICKWGYDKVSRTASQIQEDMQE